MAEKIVDDGRRRRCFLIAAPGSGASAVAKLLAEQGIDTTRALDVPATDVIGAELLRQLAAADFVVAIWSPIVSPNVAFELGVAYALGKPALILAIGNKETPGAPGILDLRGINVVRVTTPARLTEAIPDIERFLRHAKAPPPIIAELPKVATSKQSGDLSWAKERLVLLRSLRGAQRSLLLEELVAELFRRVGAEVLSTSQRESALTPDEVDLVVWMNDIAFEVGGALIVECKTYGGSSGSVVKNLEGTVRRLENVLDVSGAALALIVFDHDRPQPPPSRYETPRVLTLAVESLITELEQGSFAANLLARRRRAAFARGAVDGSA